MARFPTPTDYQGAVQVPRTAYRDPTLQRATPRENALGLPQPISGAFAVVFPMDAGNTTWAVKCFLTDVPRQRERYRLIGEHLRRVDLPYFVDFEYQEEGIRVDGTWYPILKMEWVDGVPLNRYIEEHLGAPGQIDRLAAKWEQMMEELQEADIAHGDLQHGNILVEDVEQGSRLWLVDYDTMHVPALKKRPSLEAGHRNYQHPDRSERDAGPHLDRFSSLVIYTALRACQLCPELWQRYDVGENILFRSSDFYEPESSMLLEELEQIEPLRALVKALRASCYLEPEDVPPLAEVRAGATVAVPADRKQDALVPDTRSVFERWAPRAAAAVAVTVVLLMLAGQWLGAVLIAAGAALLLTWGGVVHYRRQPVVRRRSRLREEEKHHKEAIERLEREIQSVEAELDQVHGTLDERRQKRLEELQNEALRDRLKHHFIAEAREMEGISHKVIVRLKASGVRTAYEARPERIQQITQMRDETKARIGLWRSSLVNTYRDEIPKSLSPAEKRRISRYIEHRTSDLRASIRRTREKIRQHEEAVAEVAERRTKTPELKPSAYIAHLISGRPLPGFEGRSERGTSGREKHRLPEEELQDDTITT